MATENRTPDDLQEAVAATLRRLRGEVRGPGPAAERVEPQLSAAVPQETPAPPLSAESPEPDLLSRSEPEIPPAPAERTMAEGAAAYRPGAYKEEVQPPKTRGLAYVLSFAALIVFAGIVWWAYQAIVAGPKNGPVPTITADTTPPKVPPSDQQTTDASGQGKTVYDQISGTSTQQKPEVLLPAPETPQTPPPPPAPVPSSTDVAGTATTTATTDNSNSATATQTLIPPAAPLAPATTGNATANTSSTDTASTAPAATGTSGTGTTGAGTTTDTTGAATATGSSGATTTADTGTPTGTDTTQPAAGTDTGGTASTGSVTTTPATDAAVDLYGVPTLAPTSGTTSGTTTVANADTTSATAPASSVADNFRIQLAALKSEAEANKTWKRILSKHNDVLGSLTVHIVKADLGAQGIYYRVQAGPFADKASAAAACDQLKSAGQQCLVKP